MSCRAKPLTTYPNLPPLSHCAFSPRSNGPQWGHADSVVPTVHRAGQMNWCGNLAKSVILLGAPLSHVGSPLLRHTIRGGLEAHGSAQRLCGSS
ncbi:hypothetical protein AAC387_Pa03g0755 [Persea americana]